MKELLYDKSNFDIFIKTYTGNNHDGHGDVVSNLEEPEKYPCVLVWKIEVDDNGPDYIDGEYVYLEDFEIDFEIEP
jgi:hypothetical protein